MIRAGPLHGHVEMLEQVRRELSAGRVQAAGLLIADCLAKLQETLPPEVPSLPNFEIESGGAA